MLNFLIFYHVGVSVQESGPSQNPTRFSPVSEEGNDDIFTPKQKKKTNKKTPTSARCGVFVQIGGDKVLDPSSRVYV